MKSHETREDRAGPKGTESIRKRVGINREVEVLGMTSCLNSGGVAW